MSRITKPEKIKAATGQPARQGKVLFSDRRIIRYGILGAFFCWCFFFLVLHINPAVIYSTNGTNIYNYVAAMHRQEVSPQDSTVYEDRSVRYQFILELTPEYLHTVVGRPGGWTRFAATLIIYICRNTVIGALALTGVLVFFAWIFRRYLKKICTGPPDIMCLVPSLFILILCSWYDLDYLMFLLPVAGALAVAVLYLRLKRTIQVWHRMFLLVLFLLCSWYLIQWGYVLVALFVIIYELNSRQHEIVPVIITAAGGTALLLVVDTWCIPLVMTIHWSDFTERFFTPLIMIGYFPVAAVFCMVWNRLRPAPSAGITVTRALVRASFQVGGIIAVFIWIYTEPVNRDTRTIARTVDHVLKRQWDAVLQENTTAMFKGFPEKAGALQAFMVHSVDRALCHTGRIGYDLFAFPQAMFSYDPLLLMNTIVKNGHVNWVMVLDLAMDLSMVNIAEKIAGEIMENMGPFPDIMYRRALIQLAKGNREAADVYLRRLSGMAYYRKEAKRLLSIDGDLALLSEPRVAAMRANMDTTDYFLFTISYDAMLKHLLQSNPGNKTAYDYLMTFCLLTGQLDGITALAPAASLFGYSTLPRYWEEALCINQAAKGGEGGEGIQFYGVRPETVERFNRFAPAYLQLMDDPAAAEKLAPTYGDSYFFFSLFKHTPGKPHE